MKKVTVYAFVKGHPSQIYTYSEDSLVSSWLRRADHGIYKQRPRLLDKDEADLAIESNRLARSGDIFKWVYGAKEVEEAEEADG